MIPKKYKKEFNLASIIVVLIVYASMSGHLSLVVPSLQSDLVTYADFQSGDIRFATEQVATIKCKAAGNSEIIESILITTDLSQGQDTQTFTIPNVAESKITGIDPKWGGFACQPKIFILQRDGIPICEDWQNCLGLDLDPLATYTAKMIDPANPYSCPTSYEFTISARDLMLTVSDPDGRDEVVIDSTEFCTTQFNVEDVANMEHHASNVIEDATTKGAISLEQGGTYTVNYAYDEKAPLWTMEYENNLASCDFQRRKIFYFTKVNALDGTIWAIATGKVAKDMTTEKDFCCSNADCWGALNYDTTYRCNDFTCQKTESDVTCLGDGECALSRPFVTDSTSDWLLTGSCIGGICDYVKTEIECNPYGVYYDTDGTTKLCCSPNAAGGYSLGPCESGLKQCSSNGPNACCLPGNGQYTIKEPPMGLQCCDFDGDKIGYIAETCTDNEGENTPSLNLGILEGLSSLLGGGLMGDILVFVVLGIGIFILIIIIKGSFRRRY